MINLNTASVQVGPTRRGGETRLPYYVSALAMALPSIMLGLQISGWIFFLPGAMQGHADFRHLYTAGYMLRTGHRYELLDYAAEKQFQDVLVSREQIALPFNHLAYEALLFVPYTYLSYRVAYFFFLATNVLLLTLAIRLLRPWTHNVQAVFRWLPTAMFFTFLPAAAAFMQGQDSIILLVLVAASYAMLSQGKVFTAGLLVGLGLFKFQIVLPIAVLFLLWRRWGFVAGFASSGATVLLISLWLVGSSQMNTYVHSLASMSVNQTAVDQATFAVHPIQMTNLRGLLYGIGKNLAPRYWIQILTGITSLAIMTWVLRAGRKGTPGHQFLFSVVAAALLSYHLFIHDLSILLVPLAAVLERHFGPYPFRGTIPCVISASMFSAPGILALTSFHPFVISVPLILFLAIVGGTFEPDRKRGLSAVGACSVFVDY